MGKGIELVGADRSINSGTSNVPTFINGNSARSRRGTRLDHLGNLCNRDHGDGGI